MIVAIIALSGAWFYLTRPEPPPPPPPKPIVNKMGQKVLLDSWDKIVATACKPVLGDPKAEWTMVEIGDFQCPQCGKIHGSVEALVNGSKGHVHLAFLNWPLAMHKNARRAATAALAAERQGKFWAMYDQIYEQQKGLEDTETAKADQCLVEDAHNAGLDPNRFKTDCEDKALQIRLHDQESLVTYLGAQSTPTFLLRKNGANTVYWFIGLSGQSATPMTPAYPGLKTLQENLPWAGGRLPAPVDTLMPSSGPPPSSLPPPGTHAQPSGN